MGALSLARPTHVPGHAGVLPAPFPLLAKHMEKVAIIPHRIAHGKAGTESCVGKGWNPRVPSIAQTKSMACSSPFLWH